MQNPEAFSPLCPYYRKCSGCQLQNMPYPRQLRWKQARCEILLKRFGRVSPILGMEDPLHYRCKVQSAFGEGRDRRILHGVYQSSTRSIVPVESCLTETPCAAPILRDVEALCRRFHIRPWSFRAQKGALRHVLLRKGHATGQIMAVLVSAVPTLPHQAEFASELLRLHPEITTLILNVNRDYDGLMLGEQEHILYGSGYIEDSLCGLTFRISSRSFYQVNPVQAGLLYRTAIDMAGLSGSETVVDAYCGTGTIGLSAAGRAGQVIGVEAVPSAVEDAAENARRNGIENASFFQGDAGQFLLDMAKGGQHADTVFLDPPRKGCSPEFLRALCRMSPERAVYISCNPESLARDLRFLTQKGWRVRRIQPVDMFPFTGHVECAVSLYRRQLSPGTAGSKPFAP